jgi:hypothetical protein
MTDASLALTVLAGQPTAEELAAVVVVLTAAGRPRAASPAPGPVGQWASRSRVMRTTVTPGPGAWRASSLPR